VISPPAVLASTAMVDQLIDVDLKWWNWPLLERIFSREECLKIQSIPISQTEQDDKLILGGTAAGVFSVKSAYHLQKSREDE
jgi:hypothetical protein